MHKLRLFVKKSPEDLNTKSRNSESGILTLYLNSKVELFVIPELQSPPSISKKPIFPYQLNKRSYLIKSCQEIIWDD